MIDKIYFTSENAILAVQKDGVAPAVTVSSTLLENCPEYVRVASLDGVVPANSVQLVDSRDSTKYVNYFFDREKTDEVGARYYKKEKTE